MKETDGEPVKEQVSKAGNERMEHLLSEVTPEKLTFTRLAAYASAGLSFAAILVLVALDEMSTSLHVAVYGYALAIPLFIFVADLHEQFLWHGKKSYREYKLMAKRLAFRIFLVAPYALFTLGFFATLWHLSVLVGLLTFVLSFFLLLANNYIGTRLGRLVKGADDGGA